LASNPHPKIYWPPAAGGFALVLLLPRAKAKPPAAGSQWGLAKRQMELRLDARVSPTPAY